MQQPSEMHRVSLDRKGLVLEIFELCRDIDAFAVPISCHAFFEQTVFQHQIGYVFFQGQRL